MTREERLASLRETYSSGGPFAIIMAEDVVWLLDMIAEYERRLGEPTSENQKPPKQSASQ